MDADGRAPIPVADDEPLTPDEIAPLLDNLAGPDAPLRTASLSALVSLPLSTESWLAVSERLEPFLRSEASPEPDLLAAAVRVPTWRIRGQLHSLIKSITEPEPRRTLVHALAGVRDQAAVPPLLEALRGEDDDNREWAAERLSFFDVPEARDDFEQVAAYDPSVDARFWSAICLAQLDEPAFLEQLLTPPDPDTLERDQEPHVPSAELSFTWGDPMVAFARVQGRGPWPAATQAMLERLPNQDDAIVEALLAGYDDAGVSDRQPEAGQPEPDSAEAADLRERALSLREHLEQTFLFEDVPSGDWEVLTYLPKEESASLVAHLWERLADLYDEEQRTGTALVALRMQPISLASGGNALVDMVREMGPAFVPEIEPLYHSFLMAQDNWQFADQIGWTIGRAGLHPVVADLHSQLSSDDETARLSATRLIERAGARSPDAWPPIYGGAPAAPPPRHISFVDEVDETAAMNVGWAVGAPDDGGVVVSGGGGPPSYVEAGADDAEAGAQAPGEDSASFEFHRGFESSGVDQAFSESFRNDLATANGSDEDESAMAQPSAEPAPSSSGVTGGGPAPPPSTDPPRKAHAHLQCPPVVTVGQEFALEVGIAASRDPGLFGPALERPIWSQGPYVLTVQVHAEGFTLKAGEISRHELPVTVEKPYPSAVLHLTADQQSEDVVARIIQATYFIGSQPIGVAYRPIAVVRNEGVDAPALPQPVPLGTVVTMPSGGGAQPDLTVKIAEGQVAGNLFWTFETPYATTPTEEIPYPIGTNPEQFTRQLINRLNQPADEGLLGLMRGIGRTVEQATPKEFWDLLAEVKTKIGDRPPTVFIISQDPHVPWELALVDAPFDPKSAPFLGAQATVGRWIMPRPGKTKPELPALERRSVASMAVMGGRYPADDDTWKRLEHAEKEATELEALYQATSIDADLPSMLDFLDGVPTAEVLHFAGHAIHDPESPENGLVMNDLSFFDSIRILGAPKPLTARPFIFLNACQAGAGYKILGGCAGLVNAFLFVGASGVVAPFWSVNDAAAHDVAMEFYRESFKEDAFPAEVLRRRRARFGKDAEGNDIDPGSAVSLAYQFFGHPNLRLVRNESEMEVVHA